MECMKIHNREITNRIPFEFLDSIKNCICYSGDSARKIVSRKTHLKFDAKRVRLMTGTAPYFPRGYSIKTKIDSFFS